MAAQQPLPGAAYIKVEIDLSTTTPWNATFTSPGTPPIYTDVTDDLRVGDAVTWERGRDAIWDQTNPGTVTGKLTNRSRTYDPFTNPGVVGRRPVRITCYYPTTATAYVQFIGTVDVFEMDYPSAGKDATVSFTGRDWLTALYLSKISGIHTTASVTASLQQLAGGVGIPTGLMSFASTTTTLLAQNFKQTDTATAMQMITNAAVQFLYVSRTGVLTTVAAAGSGSVVATFGDGGGSELPYTNLSAGVGYQTNAYTGVQCGEAPKRASVDPPDWQKQGGATATNDVVTAPVIAYTSDADKVKYGRIVLDMPCAVLSDYLPTATAWAALVATPGTYWISEITIKPMASPATLFPVVLNAELGQKYTVKLRPLGGGAVFSQTSVLRSIRHQVGGDDGWVVTWGFTAK
jgi:hypothetical protein